MVGQPEVDTFAGMHLAVDYSIAEFPAVLTKVDTLEVVVAGTAWQLVVVGTLSARSTFELGWCRHLPGSFLQEVVAVAPGEREALEALVVPQVLVVLVVLQVLQVPVQFGSHMRVVQAVEAVEAVEAGVVVEVDYQIETVPEVLADPEALVGLVEPGNHMKVEEVEEVEEVVEVGYRIKTVPGVLEVLEVLEVPEELGYSM